VHLLLVFCFFSPFFCFLGAKGVCRRETNVLEQSPIEFSIEVLHFGKWGRKSPIKGRNSSPPGETEGRLPDLPSTAMWGRLGGELGGDASLPDLPFFSPRGETTKPPCVSCNTETALSSIAGLAAVLPFRYLVLGNSFFCKAALCLEDWQRC
jgi:hypothetical protein